MTVKLYEKDGRLHHGVDENGDEDDSLLLYLYPAGDCDTFDWPLDTTYRSEEKQLEQIAACLFDSVETGYLPSNVERVGILPDGTRIDF